MSCLRFIIGGGVSDMSNEPVGRHGHWDKHGDWRNDVAGVSYSWFGYGSQKGSVDENKLGEQLQMER